jgi:catechol 2,3-dioxygenase-like lactoylglutathione lyase family enzyme
MIGLGDASVLAFAPATDLARARAFYVGVLGLGIVAEDDFALTVSAAGTHIRIAKVEALAPAPFTILGWQVRDVRAAAVDLAARGVVFTRYPGFTQDELGVWTAPDGARVAWFKDPDGNTLSISSVSSPVPRHD